MQRVRAFFLTATPQRTLIEAVALYVALISLLHVIPNLSLDLQFIGEDIISLGCLLFATLRLRLAGGGWRRKLGDESGLALVFSGVFTLIHVVILSAPPNWFINPEGVEAYPGMLADMRAYLFEYIIIYSLFRVLLWMWRWVYQLHRKQLRWLMTYAIVLSSPLVGVLSGIIMAIILFVDISIAPPLDFDGDSPFVIWATVVLYFLWDLAPTFATALIVMFLPAALLAFYLTRHTTRRIKQLSNTASAMQAGDLSARVFVEGEDEVTQLQTAFNAMAADLQRTMHDLAQANVALKAERDAVTRLLQERRVLIAGVSHELRTPIATLRGYLDSTLEHWNGVPTPTLRTDLEVMERETIRLQRLIDDLFTLSRAEVGKLPLNLAPTDLRVTLRRSLESTAPSVWRSGKVELIDAIPANLPCALVDEGRLEQIVRNLLRNAVRHTPPGGVIMLSAEVEPSAVIVHVKDTGEGIAPEDMPHIFECFYRAPSARERDGSGAGIGLALVKELTEAMGGCVTVTSTPGNGACLSVRLRRG
ncbi:MAG: HAMP domain-containing histidine kinase [Chloroflexales bacterium]|nr:HAMP domain-containing histidine kinase [Chloroflexales bacterium]